MKCPGNPPLAKDNVNFVGDPVAVVIAESLAEAKEAAEKVEVDYKVLKAVTSTADAMNGDTIHEGIDKNLCFDWLLGCLLYTSPSPRDRQKSRMPSSA